MKTSKPSCSTGSRYRWQRLRRRWMRSSGRRSRPPSRPPSPRSDRCEDCCSAYRPAGSLLYDCVHVPAGEAQQSSQLDRLPGTFVMADLLRDGHGEGYRGATHHMQYPPSPQIIFWERGSGERSRNQRYYTSSWTNQLGCLFLMRADYGRYSGRSRPPNDPCGLLSLAYGT